MGLMSASMKTPAALPNGVWQGLLQHAYSLIDEIEVHGIQNPFWTFGGGTVLMLRYRHRMEYDIYGRLPEWGYNHKTVCHSAREYARDEDGDGFHEVHVNTIEGFWSLLRSWLRPHRGISQESLPLYLGFFEFVHNAKNRGKRLLESLLGLLLS
jgi:transposase